MLPVVDYKARTLCEETSAFLKLAPEDGDETLQILVVVSDALKRALGQGRQARVVVLGHLL